MKNLSEMCVFPPSGYRSPLLSYPALMVVSAVVMAYCSRYGPGESMAWDEDSYVAACEAVGAGVPDRFRTPVYPALLCVLRAVFGSGVLRYAVIAVQAAAMLAAIPLLGSLCRRFTGSDRVSFRCAALFGLTPGIVCWYACVLTEVWAVCGVTAWLWVMTRDLPGPPRASSAVLGGVVLWLLVFLRPVMMCLLPVYALYWAWRWVAWRGAATRAGLAALAMTAVCAGSVAAYRTTIHRLYGLRTISTVTLYNNYFTLGEAGLLSPGDTEHAGLRGQIAQHLAEADTVCAHPLMLELHNVPDEDVVPYPVLESFIDRQLRAHAGELAVYVWRRAMWLAWPCPAVYESGRGPLTPLEDMVLPSVGLYFVFLALAGVFLVRRQYVGGRCPGGTWLLWLTAAAQVCAVLAGAYGHWARLLLPAMVPSIVLAGVIASQFRHAAVRAA